jgi:hypothetical protein
MKAPITFKSWLTSESGKVYVRMSGGFTVIFATFQALKLFGVQNIPLPKIPLTNQSWLAVNLAIQVLFIGYVVFGTAYKFSEIEDTEKAHGEEEPIWQRLELHDPSSTHHGDEKELDNWIHFKKRINRVVRQFTFFWLLGWFTWFAHYLYLFLGAVRLLNPQVVAKDFLNNMNSLMFFFLFMTLTVSTAKYGLLAWGKLICLVLGISMVEWFAFGLSNHNESVALSFTMASGLFASTALAAFVGSINSKFINTPITVILVLYVYAAIQSLYVFFELEATSSSVPGFVQTTAILITILAFILKALLFLTVTWILRTGRLVFFVAEEASLNFRRDRNFGEFRDKVKITEANLNRIGS